MSSSPRDQFHQAVKPQKGLNDAALLDEVQRRTLRYFREYAHPVSGMARERSNQAFRYDSMNTVTTGGTGFGIMALIAGAQRGFIPRDEVKTQITRIAGFLQQAETHHGAFPHFMDGTTGKTIPFSPHDDGGDIVETAFLIAGLLTARQYFDGTDAAEQKLRQTIDDIWHGVEWDFYTRGHDKLYWHWSPSHGWAMDHHIHGWNECLIAFVLGAASPTHPMNTAAYHKGWRDSTVFDNGQRYLGTTLPLGPEKGGPLFFSHYSFMGLDPRGLTDRYANYWRQNVAHSTINHAHCAANPHGHKGYSDQCWGLTASDTPGGYNAHHPLNDKGTITPTAALSSFPYTPTESMKALRHFYEDRGGSIWRTMGFADAFNDNKNWVAAGHLAIDQGPIVVMIENYRSGLLWDLFMSHPDVKAGLKKLGFSSPHFKQQPRVTPHP